MEAGVDDLEAGVAKRAGDDLGTSVVAVEAGFGDDDAVATIHSPAILRSPAPTLTNWPQNRAPQEPTAGSRTKAINESSMAAATTTQAWKISW